TASHHVDVFLAAFGQQGLQVHRRNAVGPDRCWRQVDHQHAFFVHLAGVFRVRVRRGGVEGNLDVVFSDERHQSVHTAGGDFHAEVAGTANPFGFFNADHPHRFDPVAAHGFHQQVGADVAGADDGGA